tara:strand:+ start:2823 stop:3851 length:1029 start_codon:yes stop_codon:yes gene_type:complete
MSIIIFKKLFNIARKLRTRFLILFDFPSLPSKYNKFAFYKFEISFKFWSFICKRNKKLAKFYTKENIKYDKFNISDITFDFNNLEISSAKDIDFPDIFYKTGIIIFKNFLSQETKEDYLSLIDELKNYTFQENKSVLNQFGFSNNRGIRFDYEKRNKNVEQNIYRINSKRFNHGEWKICRNLVKSFFGKDVFPKELMLINTRSNGIEDECQSKIIHIDRYLPVIKMFYSPFSIGIDQSPFQYIPTSQLIDKNYKDNIWRTIKECHFKKQNCLPESDHYYYHNYSIDDILPITCSENSLIIAATNGLHGRRGFDTENPQERWLTFMEFYRKFNKLSLLLSAFK